MLRNDSVNTQVTLFGHFSLSQGGDTLTQFSYDKVKALLVHLLLQDQPVSRTTLAALLWPDQGLSSARTNLRHALHCLRQSLGEQAERVLGVSRQTIAFQLPETWSSDLAEVERLLSAPPTATRLEQLLVLYRGGLVEELQLPQCADYQHWLMRVRGEWCQRVIAYAEQVLSRESEVPGTALRTLVNRFSGHGPFHERLVRQLIDHGQPAAAHKEYKAYLQLLAPSGKSPDPGVLQLARYWPDREVESRSLVSQRSDACGLQAGEPLRDEEIEHRQLSVMAIGLRLQGDWEERGEVRACLTLQQQLQEWLEQQCHYLGGSWLSGAGSGLGLACFGTRGPVHQLTELTAFYEHCRRALPSQVARYWEGQLDAPHFELAAGLDSGRVVYLPERQWIDPLGQVSQRAMALMSAAEGSELVISQEASQHMPPALDLQPCLLPRLVVSDDKVRLRALVLDGKEGERSVSPPALVGRDNMLRKLRDALTRAGIGVRQSILVQGAPGTGKSALLVSFRQLEQSQNAALCWLPAARLSVQEPYGVARSLLRWYGQAELNGEVLRELLNYPNDAVLFDDKVHCRRLFQALGIEAFDGDMAVAQHGETVGLVVRVLQRLVERVTADRPLLVMIDDLQWVDELSLKVLAGLQARLPINSAFLLVASHHAREALPVKLHWDQQIVLGRLDAKQSSRLLSQLAKRYHLPLGPCLRAQLIERCDGVPLYLQESCRRLASHQQEGDGSQVDALPSGLLGLLASRIDQLDEDRQIAQIAAVLGRRFRLDLLRECSGTHEGRLKQALEHMCRLAIIEPCTASSAPEFQFTPPLLQEAAYLCCPRAVRLRVHQQVIGLIEERFPTWIGHNPGDFATHLWRSGHYARGARYFELAAREALKVSANGTALRMADAGLASLRQVTGQAEREISLLTVRGQAAFALEGYGSSMAHASFARARERVDATSSPAAEAQLEQSFQVTWGMWMGCSQASADAFSLASQLSIIARRLPDPRYRRLAEYAQAHGEYWAGRIRQAHDHLQEIDPLHQPMLLEGLPFSAHPQVTAACCQSWASCLCGSYRDAQQQIEAAIRLAEAFSHPGSLALALMQAAALYRQLGHVQLAGARAERACELTRAPDLHLWHSAAQCALGWHQAMSGERAGLARVESGLDELAELTACDRYLRPDLWYVDACMALDEWELAHAYLDSCLGRVPKEDSLYLCELTIQLARVHLALGRTPQRARNLTAEALEQARNHENVHHQLRALELWLECVDPDDEDARHELRRLLEDIGPADAPVLVRWRTLLDRCLPSSVVSET